MPRLRMKRRFYYDAIATHGASDYARRCSLRGLERLRIDNEPPEVERPCRHVPASGSPKKPEFEYFMILNSVLMSRWPARRRWQPVGAAARDAPPYHSRPGPA